MKFKNDFEKKCYESCLKFTTKDLIEIQHNTVIKTEKTIVSFSGNPKKEIDVLTLNLPDNIKLLISCKYFENSVPPSAIQELGDVIKVLNENAIVSTYFGLVISSKGFSKGCEAWAKTDNLGIVPLYKGMKNNYSEEIIFKMLQRIVHVFIRIIERKRIDELKNNSSFYWMCYKTILDY